MLTIGDISKIGLGTGRLASLGDALPQEKCNELIRKGLENGVNVLDTSDTYGSGDSERAIAKAIQGQRDSFFIITKAGFPHMNLPGWMSPLNQVGKKVVQKLGAKKKYTKSYLIKSLHKSLKRLKTEAVNAFVLHEPKYAELADDTWEGLEAIRKSGMALYTGVSTYDYQVVTAGLESKQVQLIETPIFLLQDKKEQAIAEICHKNDIPVVANQVLFKLHRLKSAHQKELEQLFKKYNVENADLARVFIGYVASRQGVKNTLIGTKNIHHLIENARIATYDEQLYKDIQVLGL